MGILTEEQLFFTFQGAEGGSPLPQQPPLQRYKTSTIVTVESVDMLITLAAANTQLTLPLPLAVDNSIYFDYMRGLR